MVLEVGHADLPSVHDDTSPRRLIWATVDSVPRSASAITEGGSVSGEKHYARAVPWPSMFAVKGICIDGVVVIVRMRAMGVRLRAGACTTRQKPRGTQCELRSRSGGMGERAKRRDGDWECG
jgi:hypothetical protein